jgi:hypothetical protein
LTEEVHHAAIKIRPASLLIWRFTLYKELAMSSGKPFYTQKNPYFTKKNPHPWWSGKKEVWLALAFYINYS